MSYYKHHSVHTLEYAQKTYTFDFGKYATLANASCVVSCGQTSVLVTTTMSSQARDIDFMPLMVNYNEKFYASGKILGSRYQRREGRPSTDKTLTGRLIDRSLRPLFPKYLRNDIQIMITTLSYDNENDHDICATLGASACLTVSNIPWAGPLSACRIGRIEEKLVINPSASEQKNSDLDLFVASSYDNVVMIEAGGNQISESTMIEAIETAKESGKAVCTFFDTLKESIGKEKLSIPEPEKDEEIDQWIAQQYSEKMQKCLWEIPGKRERMAQKNEIFEQIITQASETFGEERAEKFAEKGAHKAWKNILRNAILNEEKRIAGRKLDEIRPINIEIDMFDRLHGSALFQRGETQGLSVCTLGAPSERLIIEGIEGTEEKRYFHHYNFPPYSVGECSNRLSVGNREIGHGALAERALTPVLPSEEDFPYTIRTVSEILMSNGSSSMAATCGSSLALLSAGVPISAPVGGIAMGMITSEDGSDYKILSDIQDDEDFVGDMDFKVTGTKEGITAIQMDIKVLGLSKEVFITALEQAKKGRLEILDKMNEVIAEPKSELSSYAPRLHTLQIKEEKIGKLIGKGGETIQEITKESGADIEIKDGGKVIISTADEEALKTAISMIELVLFEPEVGKSYDAIVVKIENFGAFVDIAPECSGLVHISNISDERISSVEDILSLGQKVRVKLTEKDNRGRLNFSIKDAE